MLSLSKHENPFFSNLLSHSASALESRYGWVHHKTDLLEVSVAAGESRRHGVGAAQPVVCSPGIALEGHQAWPPALSMVKNIFRIYLYQEEGFLLSFPDTGQVKVVNVTDVCAGDLLRVFQFDLQNRLPAARYLSVNAVVAPPEHRALIHEQLPELRSDHLVTEPYPRGNAAAVGLAMASLAAFDPEGIVAVLPSDHVVRRRDRFRTVLIAAAAAADAGKIVTLGITPDRADTGYGYIEAGERLELDAPVEVRAVARFIETGRGAEDYAATVADVAKLEGEPAGALLKPVAQHVEPPPKPALPFEWAIAARLAAGGGYALAVGAEKMREVPGRDSLIAVHAERGHPMLCKGRTPPGMFALLAQRYLAKYGANREALAEVAVKNHHHGSLNPKAHFRKAVTLEQVLRAPWVAEPLASPLVRTVEKRTDGPARNAALAGTGRLLAAFSLLLSAGLLVS
jgi:hypothetical protein